jgi:hypothetical protein
MTKIADELKENARLLRTRAREMEEQWREANGLTKRLQSEQLRKPRRQKRKRLERGEVRRREERKQRRAERQILARPLLKGVGSKALPS